MSGWLVMDVREQGSGVHVVPADWEACHVLEGNCACRPRLLRDGPLDEPVISHRDAAHPGATDRPDA